MGRSRAVSPADNRLHLTHPLPMPGCLPEARNGLDVEPHSPYINVPEPDISREVCLRMCTTGTR